MVTSFIIAATEVIEVDPTIQCANALSRIGVILFVGIIVYVIRH